MNLLSLLEEQKQRTAILLCLILFTAAFLRLYYLSAPSFSSDDIKTIETIEKDSIGVIIEYAARVSQPPLYCFILYYWSLIVGSSEFALRLPAAMFGIISVFALFKLACRIFDNKTALIGALLLAVNPEHCFFSYTLRQYTLTVLLALVSIELLLGALKERRTMLWIAFSICNVVLLFTHNTAILVVLTELFYIAIVFRRYKCGLQLFLSNAIICLSAIATFFLQKRYLPTMLGWIARPTAETFLNVLSSFIAGFYIKMPEEGIIFADDIHFKNQSLYIDALPLPVKIGIFAFFCFFLLFGIFRYFGHTIFQRQIPLSPPLVKGDLGGFKPFIYSWATIPVLSAYAISFLFRPVFGPTRYSLFWSCSILLLIARGFADVGRLRFVCPILFIAVTLHLFPIATQESNPRSLDWKGVANYLRETVQDGETVHFLPSDWASMPLSYYYKKDVHIGVDKVFEKITPNAKAKWTKGVFIIEAGENSMPLGLTKTIAMFYANRDVKQFYHINVTHYWKPKL